MLLLNCALKLVEEIRYMMFPAMLSVGKYMWLMFHSIFKIFILVNISILSLRP